MGLAFMLLLVGLGLLGQTPENTGDLLTAESFSIRMMQPNVVVLDVRTPSEFRKGHIANAVLMDYNNGGFDKGYKSLDSSKTYLLYCLAGVRSGKAAAKMKAAGFRQVFQLKGGLEMWNGKLYTP